MPFYLISGVHRKNGRRPDQASAAPRSGPQVLAGEGAPALTLGKINAVRAAYAAGIKPSTIARQFRISQSAVRQALAAEARVRKS